MIDRFRRWYDHERHAHAAALRSLDSVPAERRGSPEFRRATALVAHLCGARHIWLYRLGAVPQPPEALFFENVDFAELPGRLRQVEEQWSAYLAKLTDAELAREFDYTSWEGEPFRNIVEEVLTQLVTHSAYHRGQIAMLVRAAGGEPAVTDYIYWCRRPQSGEQT